MSVQNESDSDAAVAQQVREGPKAWNAVENTVTTEVQTRI